MRPRPEQAVEVTISQNRNTHGLHAEAEPTQQIKPVKRYRLPKKAKQVA